MKRFIWTCLLAMSLSLLWTNSVPAISLGFEPSTQTVGLGLFDVDVVISGLEHVTPNQIVSAFDLDVTYDDTILTATNVTFGLLLGDPSFFEADMDFDLLTRPGVVDFAELSLLSDADLTALQPDTFTLATLTFDAKALGTSFLIFSDGADDIKGRVVDDGINPTILQLDSVGEGSVNVVPEPATMLLFGSGLLSLVGLRSRFKRG